jgi:hypothetical protein
MRRAGSGLALGAGGLLCLGSVWAGAWWGDGYQMRYGSFAPSYGELAFRQSLVFFVLPGTLLLAAALACTGLPGALLRGLEALERPRRPALWAAMLALVVLALTINAREFVLRSTAITDDENVYHFQAALLASGRVLAPSPPEEVRPFFDNQFIVNDGRWFGTYFLGHAAMLTLFGKIGLGDWANCIQAALSALVAMAIARRLLGARAALLTGGLLVLSPFFVLVSATHLSQPTSSLLIALWVYAALRIEGAPRQPGWWALAAAAIAGCGLVRPQTAVALSLPFLVRLGWLIARRGLRPGWAGPAVGLIVLTVGAAVFLGINQAISGSPFRTAYHVAWERGAPWIFPVGPLHSLREISQNLVQLNFWLLGWPLSLAFVPFFRRDGRTWALAAMPIAELVGYAIPAIPTVAAVGPVYYAESIVPLAVLSASGIEQAAAWARERLDRRWARALVLWPAIAALAAAVIFVPAHVRSLRLMSTIARLPYAVADAHLLDNAVIFVRSLPALAIPPGAWVYFHRNNSPDLTDPVLWVRDLGPERNRVLIRWLRTRQAFLMEMRGRDLVLTRVKEAP